MATSSDTTNSFHEDFTSPEWQLAKQGIKLLLNNNGHEAEILFQKYPDSIQMFAGYTFAVFMDALLTFEEDKLTLALATLKESEHKCVTSTGWLKSMKMKMFRSETSPSVAEYLESQIILADSQVCIALLTFLQQDLTGYFKGGWVLRKAWKVYQHIYNEILSLHKQIVGDLLLPDPATISQPPPTDDIEDIGEGAQSSEWEILDTVGTPSSCAPSNGKDQGMDKETVTRLMGAVSFGYGLFQLGISLLPPSLLRITNFLGFGGNRSVGVSHLMYSRLGTDMRAPLATLCLLWYHTIVRPFYALDGSNVQAGVEIASQLIEESQIEYGESALFLFFKGRVSRLSSDIPSALRSFQSSVANATQREIKVVAMHEVGWCYLIQLDYVEAEKTFQVLKTSSRWSRPFYTYLTTICAGSCDNLKQISVLLGMKNLITNSPKGNQLEEILVRRFKICPDKEGDLENTNVIFWKMFVYELLYLWNTLPSCSRENMRNIITDCEMVDLYATFEPMVGLNKLIQGKCHSMLDEHESAVNSFRRCLELRKSKAPNAEDAHVSAFSQFELAMLLLKNIETKEEGATLLQGVSNFKDYDFEQRLSVRIHSILKNL